MRYSKRISFHFLMLAALFLSAPAAAAEDAQTAAEPAEAAPSMVVPRRVHDFGTVNEGAVISHSFTVKNSGDAPLIVRDIRSDCGCTTAMPESREVAPGSEVGIQTTFNTQGFVGRKVKAVRLFTNDPLNASVLLQLKGRIRPEVTIEPPRVYFREVDKGKTVSKLIKVVPLKGVTIEKIYSRSEHIQIREVPESRNSWEIALSENLPIGGFRDKVYVKTSSVNNPMINIPVFAMVVGELRFDPADLSFGLVEGPLAEPIMKRVQLTQNQGSGVRVSQVQSSDPRVSARIVENGMTGTPELEVQLAQGAVGTIRATITVQTDHPDPDQKEALLKVYGIIAEKGA